MTASMQSNSLLPIVAMDVATLVVHGILTITSRFSAAIGRIGGSIAGTYLMVGQGGGAITPIGK
jgi:hypothetical protein